MADDDVRYVVRRWRLRRGLSQRALAELSGFSQGYIAQIETGRARLEKPGARQAIAEALQISAAELRADRHGRQPTAPTSPYDLSSLRDALVSASLAVEPVESGRHFASGAGVAALSRVFYSCDYPRIITVLADAITDLSLQGRDPARPADRAALRSLVWACFFAASTCDYLGAGDLGILAAQRCQAAAQQLAEPAWQGVSAYAHLRTLPWARTALRSVILERSVSRLDAHVGSHRLAAQIFGMLHLHGALVAAHDGRDQDSASHFAEAAALADRHDEAIDNPFLFGPTNVAIWRLAMLVQLREGGRALPWAVELQPERLASNHRAASFYLELCFAFLQERRCPDALAALRRAESIAPRLVRGMPQVPGAVTTLLRHPITGRSKDLRDLAVRVGAN